MQLDVRAERFPIAGNFTISRGSKSAAEVVVVSLTENGLMGRGECMPYARYGETVNGTMATIAALAPAFAAGLDRSALQSLLPAGAARNALDCALWDLEAKRAGTSVAGLAGLTVPQRIVTAFTISLDTPEAMAAAAVRAQKFPLLKLKLGGTGDVERLHAVRAAVPDARLIVDANEAWGEADLVQNLMACREVGVELVEQPLPASNDRALSFIAHAVPICADESAHGLAGLDALVGRYDAINIKLDKTGGLTEAITLAQAAQSHGLKIMVGCMVCTSLSIAPASLLTQLADWCDLDGPLLLAADRAGGFTMVDGQLDLSSTRLWGQPV